jgi:erythromycin esterase-like protein
MTTVTTANARRSDAALLREIRAAAHPVTFADAAYDPLLDAIGDARFVLIGEASHGTHEFYSERARITRRLIAEKGFTAVAVEADWPDAYRVNRYVRGLPDGETAIASLEGFSRFPTWMWRNADVLNFIGWLREHNEGKELDRQAGFYGLDLYSLNASIESVLKYLDKVDPEAAKRARYRYGCFEDFGENTQQYGYAASFGLADPCEQEVIAQLVELQRRAPELMSRDGRMAEDELFFAKQNAVVVKNAEEYYRTMFHGRVSSWNLRDRHMVDTLNALVEHLERHGGRAKVVVWAHNSHLGDARATQMGEQGEWNIGQLVREKYSRDAVLVGFSTYTGTVTAASDWGGAAERKRVRPGMAGSYEVLFHEAGQDSMADYMLLLREGHAPVEELREPRLQRAIGVIYRPETERLSHYFAARLADQFDAIIHIDETRAVEPLERTSSWEQGEVPETFPTAL